jgi:hypothetical protein
MAKEQGNRAEENPILNMGGGLLVLGAVAWAIRTRTVGDFLWYGGWISAVILVFASIAGIVFLISEPRPRFRDAALVVLVVLIGVPLVAAFYYACAAAIKDLYLFVRGVVSGLEYRSIAAVAFAAAIPVVMGSMLFYFRLRYRSVYGLSEALVGVFVSVYRMSNRSTDADSISPDFVLAILTASVYLVVRGFDNIHQGLKQKPPDPAASAALGWIRRKLEANQMAPAIPLGGNEPTT